ncbi:MAG: L-serine ammonia-lyase, iron-sulfur-dependent, subunit alpha, partial [Lactococcus lactis]|nr:L-serine ammonia-lyase, iron-sulfur-dependent, subunit alpha [Lactococcus lactis]
MFKNIEELIEDSKNYSSITELMIAIEIEQTGRNRKQIWEMMEHNLDTMLDSVKKGLVGEKSLTGLTGGDAKLMDDYIQSGKALSGDIILGAARDAVAVNEVNAQMGLICATPTAGSAGCLPGVLTSAIKTLGLTHEQQVEFLFVAGAFGLAIANNATISGAE